MTNAPGANAWPIAASTFVLMYKQPKNAAASTSARKFFSWSLSKGQQQALSLDYVPPELRENTGEIESAEKHLLPRLLVQPDLQGDVHMHTVETDGRNTIQEMANAARDRGYKYMAITDHSKNLAFANGLDDKRAVEHIARIGSANQATDGIRIFAGIEVDILADGSLDLSDSVLEQMDLVIASVHSHFDQSAEEMTARPVSRLVNDPKHDSPELIA